MVQVAHDRYGRLRGLNKFVITGINDDDFKFAKAVKKAAAKASATDEL